MRLHSFLVGASVLGYAAAFMPAAPKVASRSAVVVQAAANVKGSMAAGNGRKVLGHYIKKLKEGGFPEKAADKQFADYTDRELDALFDLSVDEYDKMVEDAYNEVGQFSMSAEEIKGVIGEALVASEGGEKAAPLGIEADYGGAQDVLLMTGLAFERVAAKLNQGGATGADGTKYLFMTDSQLKQFDTDCNNLVTDIEAHFNEAMKPIDAKIDHWEKEFKVWETDVTKYTDMLGEIPEGLDAADFVKAFPGYQEYNDTWQE